MKNIKILLGFKRFRRVVDLRNWFNHLARRTFNKRNFQNYYRCKGSRCWKLCKRQSKTFGIQTWKTFCSCWQKVKDCGFPAETLIVGLTREGELSIPYGETVLQEGDKAIFMGSSHSLDILAGKFFHEKIQLKLLLSLAVVM